MLTMFTWQRVNSMLHRLAGCQTIHSSGITVRSREFLRAATFGRYTDRLPSRPGNAGARLLRSLPPPMVADSLLCDISLLSCASGTPSGTCAFSSTPTSTMDGASTAKESICNVRESARGEHRKRVNLQRPGIGPGRAPQKSQSATSGNRAGASTAKESICNVRESGPVETAL
eukprot:COSAG03_NODE_382_length_8333_cov_5.320986_5_plen_173_part_00